MFKKKNDFSKFAITTSLIALMVSIGSWLRLDTVSAHTDALDHKLDAYIAMLKNENCKKS